MAYSSSGKTHAEESDNLDSVVIYLKKILQHWKIVVISAVVLAVLGFAVAKLTYTPSYSSKITFIANNKSSALAVSGQTQSDLNASATLAESFKYVFTTTELSKRVADNSGFKDISVSDIKNWVSIEAVEDTAIINLTVTTPNADVSYGIANAYVNNYESAINAAFPSTTLTVIDPPLLASTPDRDASAKIYTIVGFAAGLVISIFAIVLAVIAKDTVKTADDVKDKLGVDVIGMVTHVNRKKKKKGEDYKPLLISDRRSGFPFIETFKIIRTKIEHTAQREKYKTFVVTSTAENEGKTTSAVNIALALAQNGKSVLLVDGDLRKPAVAKLLGINASDDGGVYGVINGEKTLAEAIKYSEKYNLFLLVSGKPVFDPSELLSTDAMSDIIKSAEKEFDYIIIDTAPCGVVADASILSSYADGILLVVRNDMVASRRIKRAVENLKNSGTKLVGCIYNDTESGMPKRFMSSYNKKYEYGYGYGYGYGSNQK